MRILKALFHAGLTKWGCVGNTGAFIHSALVLPSHAITLPKQGPVVAGFAFNAALKAKESCDPRIFLQGQTGVGARFARRRCCCAVPYWMMRPGLPVSWGLLGAALREQGRRRRPCRRRGTARVPHHRARWQRQAASHFPSGHGLSALIRETRDRSDVYEVFLASLAGGDVLSCLVASDQGKRS